jgi:Fe2+ transport system protein FeoA
MALKPLRVSANRSNRLSFRRYRGACQNSRDQEERSSARGSRGRGHSRRIHHVFPMLVGASSDPWLIIDHSRQKCHCEYVGFFSQYFMFSSLGPSSTGVLAELEGANESALIRRLLEFGLRHGCSVVLHTDEPRPQVVKAAREKGARVNSSARLEPGVCTSASRGRRCSTAGSPSTRSKVVRMCSTAQSAPCI